LFQLTLQQIELLAALNAEARFSLRSITYRDNPVAGGPPLPDPTAPPAGACCMIYDKGVPGSEPYVVAWATDKKSALVKALELAPTATKPMTKAQEYQARLQASKVGEQEAEIARLKAELATAQGKPATPAAAQQPPTIKPRTTGMEKKQGQSQSK
jgi:hypothetical protein